jgi:hypothetical protein
LCCVVVKDITLVGSEDNRPADFIKMALDFSEVVARCVVHILSMWKSNSLCRSMHQTENSSESVAVVQRRASRIFGVKRYVRICPNTGRDWTAALPYCSSGTNQPTEEIMMKQTKPGVSKAVAGKIPMTQDRASAIQSDTMKDKGTVSKRDFAARAARAAARNGKSGSGK